MLPKQEVVAMILAGGQGSRLGVLTKSWQSRQSHTAANTASLISHFQTVSIQVLKQLVCSHSTSHWN